MASQSTPPSFDYSRQDAVFVRMRGGILAAAIRAGRSLGLKPGLCPDPPGAKPLDLIWFKNNSFQRPQHLETQ